MSTGSDLEKELRVPPNATLLVGSSSKKASPLLIAAASGTSIQISAETSINKSSKFLLVGRQANTSDIRINHKSISRKHALLYFQSNETADIELVLKDLGGKFGCTVNDKRMEENSHVVLKNSDKVIFGNMRDQLFDIEIPDDLKICHVEKNDDDSNQSDKQIEDSNSESKPPLTGRAAREAEIAAMMDSFNQTPSYTKYKGSDIENKADSNEVVEKPIIKEKVYDVRIPIKESITIPPPSDSGPGSSGSHLATTLSLDPAGSRLLVGMSNGNIRLYDFNGMDLSLQPFKMISIQDGRYSIISTTFSNSGDRIIVGSTSAQPVVLDRDGFEIIEFTKGDMYVRDMAHTDGHVANATAVHWHPFERDEVLSASLDGSVRLWDLDKGKTKFEKLCCGKNVYRIKSSMGKKTQVTCAAFSPSGREFVCGTNCGSIQMWSSMKVGSRPDRVLYDAHGRNIPIHSLVFNTDGTKLASRSMDDDAVKVWETRKIARNSRPIFECRGVPNRYEYSNTSFSPDGKYLCAGTSVEPSKSQQGNDLVYGQLRIYDITKGSKPVHNIDVALRSSVITCNWHKKLNQIVLGLSDGSVRIFYDPVKSTKGALLPVSKGLKKQDELSLLLASRAPTGSAGLDLANIQTPHALPMFRDPEKNSKRKREKERQDPIKSRRPDLPGTGIKASEGTAAGLNFQQYNLTTMIKKHKNIAGKDPRQDLFKYQEGKDYMKGAYDGVKVLAKKTAEQEEEEGGNS